MKFILIIIVSLALFWSYGQSSALVILHNGIGAQKMVVPTCFSSDSLTQKFCEKYFQSRGFVYPMEFVNYVNISECNLKSEEMFEVFNEVLKSIPDTVSSDRRIGSFEILLITNDSIVRSLQIVGHSSSKKTFDLFFSRIKLEEESQCYQLTLIAFEKINYYFKD